MILRHFSRRDWAFASVIVVLVLIQVYLDLEIPGCMSRITVALEYGENDIIVEEGQRMLVYAFISALCAVANNYFCSSVAVSVAARLREKQYDNVLRFSKQDVDAFSPSSLITRSTNDVGQIQLFIGRGIHIIIHAPILAVWAVLKILGKDWHWTLATVVAIIIIIVVTNVVMWYSTKRFRKIQMLLDGVNTAVRDNIKGAKTIRAYNAEEEQNEKFETANIALQKNSLEVTWAMAFMFPITSALMNFLTMTIYWIGAFLIVALDQVDAQIELFGEMIVFSSYAMQTISAFMMFAAIFRMMPRAKVASRRVEEVITHVPSIPDEGTEEPDGADIAFSHVTFSYPGSARMALDDISFEVHAGETLAIIGPTGSGKTTIVNLLMRFYDPDGGGVYIGGKDIRSCSVSSIRRDLGYVPQQPILFSSSLRDNVNYGDGSGSRTDGDVMRALDVAQASRLLERMPEGLDSNISQYGRNLSGGQKQRICIARAVCKKPRVFVLDDCFSALDYITDSELRRSLKEEFPDSIRIIVAQRIGTIMDADRILVIDHGRVVGYGRHRDLLENCPLYREIADTQMSEGGHQW